MIYPLFTSRTFLSAWEAENINVQYSLLLTFTEKNKQTYTEAKAMKCTLVLLGAIYMENTCLAACRRITPLPELLWASFLTKHGEPLT